MHLDLAGHRTRDVNQRNPHRESIPVTEHVLEGCGRPPARSTVRRRIGRKGVGMPMQVRPVRLLLGIGVFVIVRPPNSRIRTPVVVEELVIERADVSIIDADVDERKQAICVDGVDRLFLDEIPCQPVLRVLVEVLPPEGEMRLIDGSLDRLISTHLLYLVEGGGVGG